MTDDSHAAELSNERAAEKRYAAAMEQRARKPLATQGARSTYWTGTGLTKAPRAAFGELVGRVALAGPDQDHLDGGSDFYIGDSHYYLDGVEVFSWAARVACTFFRGADHHDLCDRVAVIRTFAHANGVIAEFHDEPLVAAPPSQPFRRRVLLVPDAPARPRLPTRRPPRGPDGTSASTPSAATASGAIATPQSTPDAAAPAAQKSRTAVRAAHLLQAQLAAPRKDRLTSVLSTLQPDQYEIVASSGRVSRIVEGQPGTGKTIIAAHRAAFLVSPAIDATDRPRGRVLLVGPSREYSDHVAELVATLAPGSSRLEVMELPRLLELITGQREDQLKGPPARSWRDVDHELADLSVRALSQIKRASRRGHANLTDGVEQVWRSLRSNGDGSALTTETEWRDYLRRLPTFEHARDMRAFQPLLAYIAGRVQPNGALQGVGHIVVDEAQDVHPLEWDLLYELNLTGSWTILGDLNQRRSDHTEPTWERIADTLNILEDGAAPVTRLTRGYRSTRPIIQFANRLLPRMERELESLQEDGPAPLIVKTRTLAPEAVTQAHALLDRHPDGRVAVIGVAPEDVRTLLRQQGWVADRGNRRRWKSGNRSVSVLHPDGARGLEFDGVVVVEPADFPPNLGRQGQLYTALTRANRELVVVHQKPVPDELRSRRR